jgi:hypothetical protein
MSRRKDSASMPIANECNNARIMTACTIHDTCRYRIPPNMSSKFVDSCLFELPHGRSGTSCPRISFDSDRYITLERIFASPRIERFSGNFSLFKGIFRTFSNFSDFCSPDKLLQPSQPLPSELRTESPRPPRKLFLNVCHRKKKFSKTAILEHGYA